MDKYIDQALEIIKTASMTYGPNVIDGTMTLARIDAIQSIMTNMLAFALFFVVFRFRKSLFNLLEGNEGFARDHAQYLAEINAKTELVKAAEAKGVHRYDIPRIFREEPKEPKEGDYAPNFIRKMCYVFPMAILSIMWFFTINIYAYIGIFDPRVWLAYKALKAANIL